ATARRDQAAWDLLNTPEFQRLRRIRQLGVSEFTFPGATHTRFAHSVGVFHTARALVNVLGKLIPDAEFDRDRADLAVLAALLHDLGHGPFSHAFESAQKKRGSKKSHENWTSDIILNPKGYIQPILENFRQGITEHIADLLTAEVPKDVYHAVVSSSFDADRLDYLRRDRLMTGRGAGAIDFDWLIDNLRIAEVRRGGDDDVDSEPVMTFCLDEKALQAAESFLLARYHLFEQVYLHKATRCVEAMLRALLERVAEAAKGRGHTKLGLDKTDPLIRFFKTGARPSRMSCT
ncbi:MAG: HD domain-containing protein, partial [Rhodospirillales bacterium]|nr:HD domain-containing protein [Rhodospirillales bacterium]